jgi:hypothetical protein
MLKRWRTGFNPSSEYFSYRHVWVLLPGLPLNLWNLPVLKAIGNLLGRFLKVDETCLLSTDKRMARVLVELDLHAGLMDSIELEWRGQVSVQRLDYLGLSFRCSSCRQTGHLRKDCHPSFAPEEDDDQFSGSPNLHYMDEIPVGPNPLGAGATEDLEENLDGAPNTLLGKLNFYCPSLFLKLSLWERDFLGNSALLLAVSSSSSEKGAESVIGEETLGVPILEMGGS